jgi:competence protein ComEA
MAFLLGVAVALLTVHGSGYLRHGSRPAELERGPDLSYRVELNRARRPELLQLPGVGDRLADRIEDYRSTAGGFRSVDELRKVPGVGPAVLERLRPWVFVEATDTDREPDAPAPKVRPLPVARQAAPAVPGKSKKVASLTGRIDINEAPLVELQRLPGIGPKLSQRIVDTRQQGRFQTVDELRRVPGIGTKTMEKLRPYIQVRAEAARTAKAD